MAEDDRGNRLLRDDLYNDLSGSQKKFYMELRDLASRTFTNNGELLDVINFLFAEMEADRRLFDNMKGHYDYRRSDIINYEPIEPK